MTENHLLSPALFKQLFKRNMVSADGRITANKEQLQNYYSFLVQQSKDKTSALYLERKNIVNDIQKILNKGYYTDEEVEVVQRLLDELDLKHDDSSSRQMLQLVSLKKVKTERKKFLGPKEPKKSLFEREVEEELRRVHLLKRDLRTLDEWLDQISKLRPAQQVDERDWREAERKFRQRTKNRMCDMENARKKLIKHHFEDYDKKLKAILRPRSHEKSAHVGFKFDRIHETSAEDDEDENCEASEVDVEDKSGETLEADDEGDDGETLEADDEGDDGETLEADDEGDDGETLEADDEGENEEKLVVDDEGKRGETLEADDKGENGETLEADDEGKNVKTSEEDNKGENGESGSTSMKEDTESLKKETSDTANQDREAYDATANESTGAAVKTEKKVKKRRFWR